MTRDASFYIAVTGIAARFPGVADIGEWWSAVKAGLKGFTGPPNGPAVMRDGSPRADEELVRLALAPLPGE